MSHEYASRLVKAMTYKLLHSHNSAKLVEEVNAALADGAVFCGGPVCPAAGGYAQAVVWPEVRDYPEPSAAPGNQQGTAESPPQPLTSPEAA